jgi:glucokinase
MSLYAGFDLGGTHLKYGLINERGGVVFNSKSTTPPFMDDLISLLRKTWETLKKREPERIASAGFGFPGIFNLKEQKIFQSPNYPEIDNFDLISALSRFVDVPFWIDNDANMAAFGEFKRGAGQGVQSMVLLTIGTGIGSGIILGGKLWHGKCGFAGELGHVIVNPNGERCKCGSQGCLETESSAPKIVKNYKIFKKTKEDITAEDVYHRAKKGDQAAVDAFAQAGFYLGIGLASIINFINPEKMLLGGAVTAAGDFLLSPAVEEARRRSYRASFECCRIEKAALGNKAGFIGSAFWAKEQINK